MVQGPMYNMRLPKFESYYFIESVEQIRKIDPSVHIVIVTGYSDFTYDDFLEIAGPSDRLTYMPKPVWPDQLRKVARILAGEKSHRSQLSPTGVIRSA